MQLLYRSDDWLYLNHLRNLLEEAGIEVWMRHALMGGAGQLPINESWPEIWVVEDEDLARAEDVLRAALEIAADEGPQRAPGASWTCQACGEVLEPQFDRCWRCGARRDSES